MNKFVRFIKTGSNWTSIIVFVVALSAFALSFLLYTLIYQIITAMFIFIAVENFIVRYSVLDEINNKIDEKLDDINMKIDAKNESKGKLLGILSVKKQDVLQRVKDAKSEVYLSGIELYAWAGVEPVVEDICNKVKVRILVVDPNNKEVLDFYETMRGETFVPRNNVNNFLARLKNRNVEIRLLDTLLPTVFLGIDMHESYGHIKAVHLFNEPRDNIDDNLPVVELTSSDYEMYEVYKNAMERVWERGISFKKDA